MKAINNTLAGRIIVICFLSMIYSCDCGYMYDYKIINNSSGSIKAEVSSVCEENAIIIIAHDSSAIICSHQTVTEGCKGPYDNNLRFIFQVKIYLNDTILAVNDYTQENRWVFYEKNKTGQYELTITDNDFNK